jgi:putative sterol carrier protein
MSLIFPSPEWIAEYKIKINSSQYKVTGVTWDKGPIALVCKANPQIGLPDDAGIWLDLHKGECRDAKLVPLNEAMKAPFCITGDYDRWKQVIRKELEPIKGMMQGKLRLKGDLPTIVRYVEAAKTLVECAGLVPTKFLDE